MLHSRESKNRYRFSARENQVGNFSYLCIMYLHVLREVLSGEYPIFLEEYACFSKSVIFDGTSSLDGGGVFAVGDADAHSRDVRIFFSPMEWIFGGDTVCDSGVV